MLHTCKLLTSDFKCLLKLFTLPNFCVVKLRLILTFVFDDFSMDKQEADDKDEVSSTVSDLSELSGLSDLSGQDWKPIVGQLINIMLP